MDLDQLRDLFINHSRGCSVIGIGSGRTMQMFSKVIADDKTYVSTSLQTDIFLENKKVNFCGNVEKIDVYFDGVDYYNRKGDLIKGFGGAIVLEKLLYSMSDKTVILAQKNKYRESFEGLKVPVVIMKESYGYFMSKIKDCKATGVLRKIRGFSPYVTDQGHVIVDVEFFEEFAERIPLIAGVVEHGYFKSPKKSIIIEIFGTLE